MNYNTVKSKRDVYELLKAKLTITDDELKVDMILRHIPTQIETTGLLIVTTRQRPGRFRDSASDIKKKEDVMENIITHLIKNSYLTQDGYLFFEPNKESVLINSLYENVTTNLSVHKARHR